MFTFHRMLTRCLLAGLLLPSLAAATRAEAQSGADLAVQLIERSGLQRGICVVLGDDRSLAVEIAKASELQVHCRQPNAEVVTRLRSEADAAGLDIHHVAIDHGPLNPLPYADNVVDLLIAPVGLSEDLKGISLEEIVRVLRPEGRALVGNWSDGAAAGLMAGLLKTWSDAPVEGLQVKVVTDDSGVFADLLTPPLAGAGDWSHWEHGPDNNPVSEDTVIKAPYMTQFMARPYYIAMPSITTAAGGRTFLAIGHIAHHRREWGGMNKLIARNGYNGTVLWERKLPEGYMVHRSAFIATKETFYMMDGSRCLLLDPQNGDPTGTIRIPGVTGEWKWMVMRDGVLYVLAGRQDAGAQTTKGDRAFGGWSWGDLSKGYYRRPRVPWGFGNTLVAWDIAEKKRLWLYRDDTEIDSRSMALTENGMFFYSPESHLGSLDLENGEIQWKNEDREVLDLIEEPGKGLVSTPGFRSACLAVATPGAVIIQGQTRMNVVAISTTQGYKLWTKKKFTNNSNAIYVDGQVIMGVGERGSHVAMDPITGEVIKDLGFRKTACTRLTACSDSFFVRGEGTLRYDRETGQVLIDGAQRPACNDGALPANGLLYLGPWQCDCNLSLIGRIAKCSAGDFDFDHKLTNEEHLTVFENAATVADFDISADDWPTLRGDVDRSGSTSAKAPASVQRKWQYTSTVEQTLAMPVAAGGLIFVSGSDGKTRAIDAASGQVKWEHATPGEIRMHPTIADGRVFVGSGDGHVYALEAATGRPLWKFRAAPVERLINVYGALTSTWPVNSGVVVHNGVAYFAAGIIDHDGTSVYALDAKTGQIQWQNHSSGHLNKVLRKGVSVQGNLTIQAGKLLLAGGNQVSPATFDLETGKCLSATIENGRPKANNGQFIGLFQGDVPLVGGRILFSAAENVATKGSFSTYTEKGRSTFSWGGIAPSWSDQTVAMVNYRNGKLTCFEGKAVRSRVAAGIAPADGDRRRRRSLAESFAADGATRWQTDLGEANKFEAISIVVCPNAVIAVIQQQQEYRAQPQWYVVAFDSEKGRQLWRHEVRESPLPGGLLVDRDGQVVVTMLSGNVQCLTGS